MGVDCHIDFFACSTQAFQSLSGLASFSDSISSGTTSKQCQFQARSGIVSFSDLVCHVSRFPDRKFQSLSGLVSFSDFFLLFLFE